MYDNLGHKRHTLTKFTLTQHQITIQRPSMLLKKMSVPMSRTGVIGIQLYTHKHTHTHAHK